MLKVINKNIEIESSVFSQNQIYFFCGCCCFWACSVSGTTVTGEACYCSENLCTDAQFCYDGVCNENAQGTLSVLCFPILFWIVFGEA